MNRVIFSILLILLAASLLVTHTQLTLLLALLKILLVAFFYMELRHAHRVWQVGFLAFVLTTYGTLLLIS